MVVSQQQLQQYAAFLQQVPSAVFVTDNTSFVYVRNISSSATVLAAEQAAGAANNAATAAAAAAGDARGVIVDAYSVTLIAPSGTSINNTPITVLQTLAASRAMQQQQQQQTSSAASAGVDATALAAAAGDAAGIVAATDSYALAATDATLLQLLQQLNSEQQQASAPLLIHLATNVSLAPRFWGSAWPADGLVVRRPVVFVGSGWRPTSIDLKMEVGQVRAQARGALPDNFVLH
jgi:hypothetical protein